MANNQPSKNDAVMGSDNSPPVSGIVLGGIEGVKHRLSSNNTEERITALSEALNYGEAGLNLLVQAYRESRH